MNMNNMEALFKLKGAWDTFTRNHPKFPKFLKAVLKTGIKEDTIIAISITDPDGKVMDTNLKVTASDLELLETIKNIRP